MAQGTIVPKDIIPLTFHNDKRNITQFPVVGITVEGTKLIVFTRVPDVPLREEWSLEKVQRVLDKVFDPLTWKIRRQPHLKSIELFGLKDVRKAGITIEYEG